MQVTASLVELNYDIILIYLQGFQANLRLPKASLPPFSIKRPNPNSPTQMRRACCVPGALRTIIARFRSVVML